MFTANIKPLDIGGICDSGQVFRMYRRPGSAIYDLYAGADHLALEQEAPDRPVTFWCDEEEYLSRWKSYFDLDRDYGALAAAVDPSDRFLSEAASQGIGIRILRQEVWETMISFIISQQKQIPSIRKCIEALSARFGRRVSRDGFEWYAFPTAEAIAAGGPSGLDGLSLGYRARYIYETAVRYLECGVSDEVLRAMDYEEALSYLKAFTGIGEKVAGCILLFGGGFCDAFPIDVHIKDILFREYYSGPARNRDELSMAEYKKIADDRFRRYAGVKGIVQQWIFAYELSHKLQ